ncbi:hypothetical protein GCM10028789_13470 [Sinomonas halotolerans]
MHYVDDTPRSAAVEEKKPHPAGALPSADAVGLPGPRAAL